MRSDFVEVFPNGFPGIALFVDEEMARKRIKVLLKKRSEFVGYKGSDPIEIEL